MEPQSWVEQLVPVTLHATAVLEEPVTVAVNCWVVATTTLCVLGSMATVTDFLPPKPRSFSMLLILQAAQEKQERTKRTVVSDRMPLRSRCRMGMLNAIREFSSIAYGGSEASVVHSTCAGNVQKRVRSERSIGVGDVES